MKLRDLKKTINEAINEALTTQTDKTVVNISSQDPQKDMKIQQAKRDKKSYQLYEDEKINEMARTAINYKLTPDYKDKLEALNLGKGEKVKAWYNGTVDYLNQVGKSDFTTIALEKFGKTQHKFAEYGRNLIRAGVIEPAGMKGSDENIKVTPQFQKTDDELSGPKTMSNFNDDDLFIGGGFSDDFETGTLGGEEETEPSPEELEPKAPVTKQNMSDEEAEKLMDYLDLKQWLEQVKGTIRSKKKSSLSGDIRGKVTDRDEELEKARERKNNLERKIADLVASSPYLQRRVKNEDEINESAKKRLKKLANIQ